MNNAFLTLSIRRSFLTKKNPFHHVEKKTVLESEHHFISKSVKRLEMGKTEGGGWYSQVGQGGVENLGIKKWKT